MPPDERAIASQEDSVEGSMTETSGQFASINTVDESYDAPHTAVQDLQQEPALEDTPPHMLASHSTEKASTPRPPAHVSSLPAPTPLRSALKSTSATPVSAMQDGSRGRQQTPAHRLSHRRSVSFSDGKRDGPIAGLGRNLPTPDGSMLSSSTSASSTASSDSEPSTALVPSARSKRIAEMLEGLEGTCECYLH